MPRPPAHRRSVPPGAEHDPKLDPRIRVAGIEIAWKPQDGVCTFEGLPVIMTWVDSTLAGLMSGVQAMVGTERFMLALQAEGRKSVAADWQIITAQPDFARGFAAIATVAAVAGWGRWHLVELDQERRVCRFRVADSWEGRYQRALGVCWGSGMLAGKFSGYCSWLFGANCWADQTAFIARGDPEDEFVVTTSSRSLEREIESLLLSDEATRADMAVALHRLENEMAERRRADAAREQLEAQLGQATKMEAVGRLAGGIAHDFNNLLTGILGNLSLARARVAPGDPLAETLSEVERAAASAAALTYQLLAFSRKQVIEPRTLSLNDLIGKLTTLLGRLLGEDISLEARLDGRLGSVHVDPGQFEQVLVNLAVNARDAMPEGGRLRVETRNVLLDPEFCRDHPGAQPGPHVMLSVSDTGEGMSDEVKLHLFEPFFTTKPLDRGTGLGLATVFGTVKQAGGFIEVDSAAGRGTSFRIYLRRVDGAPVALEERPPDAELPTGSETILVVEDQAMVREVAVRLLETLGYRALQAPDGEEALRLAEGWTERIDLLMTDVVMPRMSGHELAERMVHLHPESRTLFASGYTEDVVVRHGVATEKLRFLRKPYDLRALALKLREVLDA